MASVVAFEVNRVSGTIYGCQRPSRAPDSSGSRECRVRQNAKESAVPADPLEEIAALYAISGQSLDESPGAR